jgi:alpha-L-rhamnosidase
MELIRRICLIIAAFLPAVLGHEDVLVANDSTPRAVDLRCEYRASPLGIDELQPRLSWILQAAERAERGLRQTAYQIMVASSPEILSQDCGDLWDSGKIESDQSIQIEYAGRPLESERHCFWKVRVWDQTGRAAAWSEPARWSMGLLKPEDWKAKWIGLGGGDSPAADDHRRLPSRMLRREFDVAKKVVRATVFMSGLGFSELYMNGRKVGDRVMDPTQSRYDKRAMYVAFDVTDRLHSGRNAIGVILGNGRFYSPRLQVPAATPTFGYPKLLFQMRVEYADGTSQLVTSDRQWTITDRGPIRANSEFDGEEYDARLEQIGWDKPGFDDSAWRPVQILSAPGGQLIAQMLEPMRVIETLHPLAIAQPQPGVYVADFGQNLYGMVRIKVTGPRGTRIAIRATFDRHPDGMIDMAPNRSALSTDVYVLNGNGVEKWVPRFRGQGTRFAEIKGWPGVPTKDDLELLVVHTDLKKTGEFACSNELVNKIYANMRRTVRMQERGVPMDPDRDERQAWLSVSEKTSETEGYMYDLAAFYTSFLGECRIDQRDDGCLSDAGSFWPWSRSGDTCWPAVVVTVPWSCYLMYGDRRILTENYPMMKRWGEFLEKEMEPDGLYRKRFYGDWVDAYSMDGKAPDSGGTSYPLMESAYAYYDFHLIAQIAGLLGHAEDAARFSCTAKKVGNAFQKTLFDPRSNTYESKTQTSYVLPLAFGLTPQGHRQAVIDNLVQDIMVQRHGHLTVGVVGIKWLMQTLTAAGRTDVAYTILTQTTRPSWGYMVGKDGTSIWERWDRDTRDPGMNGQSQTILVGYLGAWMYQTLGGINYDPKQPGFKHIIMRPEPVVDLKWVRASYKSPYGTIVSNWRTEDGKFLWDITVPTNTTATVCVPAKKQAAITEGGKPADQSPGLKFLRYDNGAAEYSAVSGQYSIESQFP